MPVLWDILSHLHSQQRPRRIQHFNATCTPPTAHPRSPHSGPPFPLPPLTPLPSDPSPHDPSPRDDRNTQQSQPNANGHKRTCSLAFHTYTLEACRPADTALRQRDAHVRGAVVEGLRAAVVAAGEGLQGLVAAGGVDLVNEGLGEDCAEEGSNENSEGGEREEVG
jgi:hypothetical protein